MKKSCLATLILCVLVCDLARTSAAADPGLSTLRPAAGLAQRSRLQGGVVAFAAHGEQEGPDDDQN